MTAEKLNLKNHQRVVFITLFAAVIFFLGRFYLTGLFVSLLAALMYKKKHVYETLIHPKEVLAMIKFKMGYKVPSIPTNISIDQEYCYIKLGQVSRSFSAVILSLNEELKEAICLFYLVCRAIDTIEDDMKPDPKVKIPELRDFWKHLEEDGWNLKSFGDKPEEIDLLVHFDRVIKVYKNTRSEYRDVIQDIAKKMGNGMADFLTKKVVSLEDYNLYCWYVAGLVGEGLSRLFSASKLEDPKVAKSYNLYKSMGLFLQKTNIIRDYLEDIVEVPPRVFYPNEIWSKYVDRVEDLKDPRYKREALLCLNHMVTDAMDHAEDCVKYLSMLKDPSVFLFCAIPQVMAIATLQLCYNNYEVFQKEVKIRKSLAVQMIMESTSMSSVVDVFLKFSKDMEQEIPKDDLNGGRLKKTLHQLQNNIRKMK